MKFTTFRKHRKCLTFPESWVLIFDEFIGCGAMDGHFPYAFIGFGDMDDHFPFEFIGSLPKSYVNQAMV